MRSTLVLWVLLLNFVGCKETNKESDTVSSTILKQQEFSSQMVPTANASDLLKEVDQVYIIEDKKQALGLSEEEGAALAVGGTLTVGAVVFAFMSLKSGGKGTLPPTSTSKSPQPSSTPRSPGVPSQSPRPAAQPLPQRPNPPVQAGQNPSPPAVQRPQSTPSPNQSAKPASASRQPEPSTQQTPQSAVDKAMAEHRANQAAKAKKKEALTKRLNDAKNQTKITIPREDLELEREGSITFQKVNSLQDVKTDLDENALLVVSDEVFDSLRVDSKKRVTINGIKYGVEIVGTGKATGHNFLIVRPDLSDLDSIRTLHNRSSSKLEELKKQGGAETEAYKSLQKKDFEFLERRAQLGSETGQRLYPTTLKELRDVDEYYAQRYAVDLKYRAQNGDASAMKELAGHLKTGKYGFPKNEYLAGKIENNPSDPLLGSLLISVREVRISEPKKMDESKSMLTSGEPEIVTGIQKGKLKGKKPSVFAKGGSRYSSIEDRHVIAQGTGKPPIQYRAVYDGHGGNQVSDFLAKEFHLYLDKHRSVWKEDPKQIALLFAEFDDFARLKWGKSGFENAGSTGVMMIDRGQGDIIIVNLGDSPAVVVKTDGTVLRSKDHEPSDQVGGVGAKVEGNKYIADDGGKLSVGRTFGDNKFKPQNDPGMVQPDIYTIPREDVAFVALMSDGVPEAMNVGGRKASNGAIVPENSVEGLAQSMTDAVYKDSDNAAQAVYDGLKQKGTDDVTIMVIPVN